MNKGKASTDSGYERSDANVFLIAKVGASLAVGIGICFVVAGLCYRGVRAQLPSAEPATRFQHGTENDSTIARDWREQDAAVRAHLEQYAWVDRPAGVVRIPVARAMELMVREADHPREKTP